MYTLLTVGYNIYIGNAEPRWDFEEGARSAWVDVPVIDGTSLGAPLDSTTKGGSRENMILPGYNAWSSFCRRAKLHDVFFHQSQQWTGASGDTHPTLFPRAEGVNALHPDLLNAFQSALKGHRPRIEPDGVDWDDRRLNWLVWWTKWSLDNCEFPTMVHG